MKSLLALSALLSFLKTTSKKFILIKPLLYCEVFILMKHLVMLS